ncbi:MAG: ATP-grasp domain-containing protein [Blastopirellula sp. JB062]
MAPLTSCIRIAVVGSSCRAAVACLRRCGVPTIAADQFADADLRKMAPATQLFDYPAEIPAWLSSAEATHWLYVGGLENHPEVLASAAAIRPLLGVAPSALATIRDPLQLQHHLRAAGFRFPATESILPAEGHWLQKPIRSAGGLNVVDVNCSEVDGVKRNERERHDASVVYQRFISGGCYGAAFVAINGTACGLGVTRQLIGRKWGAPQAFQYAGSIGPVTLPETLQDQLQRLANFLAQSTSLIGLYGIDFIINGDEIWPIEINPRFTAAMELLPENVMRRHLEAWALESDSGDTLAASSPLGKYRGKLYVYAASEFAWTAAFAKSLADQAEELALSLADIPSVDTKIPAMAPAFTLLGASSNAAELLGRLREGSKILLRQTSRLA